MCIWIINYEAGQTVYQPVIQLFGFDSLYHETILVNNKYQWPIVQGLFKVYSELNPGENIIQFSTLTSELSFKLFYSPLNTTDITLRLVYITLSDDSNHDLENMCKKFVLLTKLVRCTFDEILYKQTGYKRSSLFNIERKIHHITMLKKDFEDKLTGEDIFKEVYRQIFTMNIAQDSSIKLVINSFISSSIFAYTFNSVILLNLPEHFKSLPISLPEFYENLYTQRNESLFFAIGAYLHELGHLFGLDHGNDQSLTIMSSSKDYINSGKQFFLTSPHLCSIIFNRICSCYKEPFPYITCSYSNGLLSKHSINVKSSCKTDTHCQFSLKFNLRKCKEKPNQCECSGQYQFDTDHCQHLMTYFEERKLNVTT